MGYIVILLFELSFRLVPVKRYKTIFNLLFSQIHHTKQPQKSMVGS